MRVLLPSGEVHDADELAETRVRPPPAMPAPRSLTTAMRSAKPAPTSAPPRTDRELLEALMAHGARLTIGERSSFGQMLDAMKGGRVQALSYAQRAWAQEVGARIGLDVAKVEGWREVNKDLKRKP